MIVDKNIEGVTRLVGAVVNNRGDICAYRDLGYLARMKGFSL